MHVKHIYVRITEGYFNEEGQYPAIHKDTRWLSYQNIFNAVVIIYQCSKTALGTLSVVVSKRTFRWPEVYDSTDVCRRTILFYCTLPRRRTLLSKLYALIIITFVARQYNVCKFKPIVRLEHMMTVTVHSTFLLF